MARRDELEIREAFLCGVRDAGASHQWIVRCPDGAPGKSTGTAVGCALLHHEHRGARILCDESCREASGS